MVDLVVVIVERVDDDSLDKSRQLWPHAQESSRGRVGLGDICCVKVQEGSGPNGVAGEERRQCGHS